MMGHAYDAGGGLEYGGDRPGQVVGGRWKPLQVRNLLLPPPASCVLHSN